MLLQGVHKTRCVFLDGIRGAVVAVGKLGSHFEGKRHNGRMCPVVGAVGGGFPLVHGVVHELDDLLRHAEGLLELVLVPVVPPGAVPHAAHDHEDKVGIAETQARGLGALDGLKNQMLHAGFVEAAHGHAQCVAAQTYAGIVVSFQHADYVLPVLGGLARAQDFKQLFSVRRDILVDIDVLEGKGHVAEGDLDGFLLELAAVCGLVDELLLLGGEVSEKENLGVDAGEQLGELGRRGFEVDGECAWGVQPVHSV